MKFACLAALLLPTLAMARPQFEIPEHAYKAQARCTIERSTRKARGKGWTDWRNEKDSETFHFTHWATPEAVNSIEDRGHHIKYTKAKNLSEDEVQTKRHEMVEEWVLQKNKWRMKAYLLDVTIQRRKNGPNLLIERWEDGRAFQWETSTAENGTITKNLLNPEILNTKERQIGLLRTVCRR